LGVSSVAQPNLGFNQPASVHAFPSWALTNQFSVALSQVGTGQNHFRLAFPTWDRPIFFGGIDKFSRFLIQKMRFPIYLEKRIYI